MRSITTVVSAFALALLAPTTFAVTGSTYIIAVDPIGYGVYSGYRNGSSSGFGYGNSYGSLTSPTLSDGRVIIFILDESAGGMGLSIAIKGFTSDPGRYYFNNLNMDCTGYNGFPTSAATTYYYDSTRGIANWSWGYVYSAPGVFVCMPPDGSWYNMSID
jgi:hypothetical protein